MPKQTDPIEVDARSRAKIPQESAAEGASLLSWVGDLAGRVGVDRVGSYLGAERVGNVLGEAMQSAARTKARLDKNMQLLLTVVNLPSKRDYERLQVKLDALQAGLMTVSSKLDRLYDELDTRGTWSGNGIAIGDEEAASTLSARARAAIARSAAAAAGRAVPPAASTAKKVVASKQTTRTAKNSAARTRKSTAASAAARKTTRR